MKTATLTLVAGLASVAMAQLPPLPGCATSCLTGFTSGSGTVIAGCNQYDINCICSNGDFLSGIACCLAAQCTEDEQTEAVVFARALCRTNGVTNLPASVTCDSTTSQSATSSASAAGGSTAPTTTTGESTTPATTTGGATTGPTTTGTSTGSTTTSGGSTQSTGATSSSPGSSSTSSPSTSSAAPSSSPNAGSQNVAAMGAGIFGGLAAVAALL